MKVKSKIFYWYVAFVLVFIALVLLPAPDKATLIKYHLSPTGLRLLTFTLIVPEILIWFAAFYGYQKLYRYGQLIKLGADGKQIAKLSRGLLFLALGLPVTALFGGVLSLIAAHSPSFKNTSIVINAYAGIVFPLLAFLWMSIGARGLTDINRTRTSLRLLNITALIVITLGVVFCCLIVLDHQQLRNVYHMSPEFVMLTLGVPYIYIWFLGLSSVAELFSYSRELSGVIYRQGWNLLIGGLAAIIALSILLQCLNMLSTWLTSLSLGGVLLLLYVLLLLLTGAFIVVALGTNKLMKIEEV